MNLVFFGTSVFAAKLLQSLKKKHVCVLAIVTQPDKPQKRSKKLISPPVKKVALEQFRDVPLFQPEKASDPLFIQKLKQIPSDFFVVAAYGQILSQKLLDLPKVDCLNVHTSLLPLYRGASPIRRCLMDGRSQTGITIMRMVLKLDAGEILSQKKINIPPNMTFSDLQEKLLELSGPALLEVIKSYDQIQKIPQDHKMASYAHKLEKKDLKIDWNRPALEIHNQIRALSETPGAWCNIKINSSIKRLKILQSELENLQGSPGHILYKDQKSLVVACAKDAIKILRLQLEGKKMLPISEWLLGMYKKNFIFS